MLQALLILLFGTIFFTCALTPVVFELLQHFEILAAYPFSRIYDRVALVVVFYLFYLLRSKFDLKVFKNYFAELKGLSAWKYLSIGLLVAVTSVFILLPVLVDSGRWSWNSKDTTQELFKLMIFMPAAILVAVIEEAIFRVLIQNKLLEKMNLLPTVLLTSFFYAFVHFIEPAKSFVPDGFQLFSGFYYIFLVFKAMISGDAALGFFGLYLVGCVLSLIINRTGLFFLAVGVHAGWAFALKASKYFIDRVDHIPGRYILLLEPLTWIAIIILGATLVCIFRRKNAGICLN